MTKLSEFIGSERERFANEDNNKFAISFSQISRYSAFLDVIFKRYEDASRLLFQKAKAFQETLLSGKHPLADDQMALHEESFRLTILVHLEIESFYLFAKILLDKIAHSLEFYFGQGRKTSLDSHDDLVKNFASYAVAKGLTLPADFMTIVATLKKDISDYRDYEIAHEKSPRRLNATVFDEHGTMRMAAISLYPTEKDQQVESKALHELARDLDAYITRVIELIRNNGAKTKLKTE
jgi:hypothetical protein